MNTPSKSVNAWIYLDEDEPSGTSYRSPTSSYQNLIKYGVYNATDMVDICFFVTVPTSSSTVPAGDGSSYTVEIGNIGKAHPDGSTNQQYLQWLIRDARAVNPNAKLLATLGYGGNELSAIFSNTQKTPQQNATAFAANLLAYLKQYDLDGFDVDWESPLDYSITSQQFQLLFTAIRAAFATQTGRHYYLTLSPASVGNLDAATVNNCFDLVNLQLYSGFTIPSHFIEAGVSANLLAYGAKFESAGNGDAAPFQNAQQAYQGYASGGYRVCTQWRLNSGNYQFEQAQQMMLYQLVNDPSSVPFDDTLIVGAAGNPPLTQLVVRSGEVLDAIQATNTGSFEQIPLSYALLQHGGNGGGATTVTIPAGDSVAEISGYTGNWYGWNCVLQLTVTTRRGTVFGPFGNMVSATGQTPFSIVAPAGQSIVAFSGSVVNVPLASGGTTNVIATLNATYAPL